MHGVTTTPVMEPDGHAGFRFAPGQFGWLTLWQGPLRITGHPFSFSVVPPMSAVLPLLRTAAQLSR